MTGNPKADFTCCQQALARFQDWPTPNRALAICHPTAIIFSSRNIARWRVGESFGSNWLISSFARTA
jgi:hypothetical protein